jgi:hypothetical protein
MRLNIIAFAVSVALVWAGALFLVGCANLIWPPYGRDFLDLAASIYPGYHVRPDFASVIIGTLYGLVDGGIGGAIFAWLYNFLVRRFPNTQA